MTKIKEVYRCNICGNVVKVIDAGEGTLVCCGQDMELISETVENDNINQETEIKEEGLDNVSEIKEEILDNQEIKTEPISKEQEIKDKHTPIIEKKDNKVIVTISKIEHPMTKDHHISWIEVSIDGSLYMKKLNSEEKPVLEIKSSGKRISARALCNIHGLWKSSFE